MIALLTIGLVISLLIHCVHFYFIGKIIDDVIEIEKELLK